MRPLVFVHGYLGGNSPVSIFTQGWFSVSNFRPLIQPLDPASVAAGVDTSKVQINGPVRYQGSGGGYSPGRKYMMAVNTVWFLRRHGTPARWLSFLVFDVLTLAPPVVVGALDGRLPGVLAKARGTWDGLRGRRVTRERLERVL